MSIALETIRSLGGELGLYVTKEGQSKAIDVLVQPLRRTDELGNQIFLSKTYELWFVKGETGIEEVIPNSDTIGIFVNKLDLQRTYLKITKLYPERDEGIPGDGVGMWHVEAVQ